MLKNFYESFGFIVVLIMNLISVFPMLCLFHTDNEDYIQETIRIIYFQLYLEFNS